MLSEQDCPPAERFLPLVSSLDYRHLPRREEIEARFKNKASINEALFNEYFNLDEYYNWTPGENELLAYVGFAYCDLALPKTYSWLIDFKDPGQSHACQAIVKFAFWNQIPLKSMAEGYRTFAIIEFPHGIPQVIARIPSWELIQAGGDYDYLNLGLCEALDVEEILGKKRGIKNTEAPEIKT